MSKSKQVKARVLADNQFGKINDVVTLDETTADQAQAAGMVDTHPSAVKQAEALAKATKPEQESGKDKG